MTNLTAWWGGLSDESRDRLMKDPFGFVPPGLISADGPAAIGAWWPETQNGPAGLEFPHRVQVFIESKRLRKVHDDLEAERRELLDRYFPITEGPGPIVWGEGFPDDETAKRYHELDGLIVDARRAWIEWIVENRR